MRADDCRLRASRHTSFAPKRTMNVSRPGTPSGFKDRLRATASSGDPDGPHDPSPHEHRTRARSRDGLLNHPPAEPPDQHDPTSIFPKVVSDQFETPAREQRHGPLSSGTEQTRISGQFDAVQVLAGVPE
ncbi:hypothetical protein [Streptomyces hypolithicus]